ncbi:MAG: CoA transferase [Acidimicrobiia bacterium]|nr:CoA transferase [Acidimicrobiia bacterium]
MGPLRGIRVVELASLGPGPFCGMMLADMGADVIRLERPTPVNPVPGDPSLDVLNRGKKSVAIDLKHPEAASVVLDLVGSSDVFIEGFRPGVCERLGIGPEPCMTRNPQLIYGRMTGWGQEGPLAETAGHDITYLARAGGLWSLGHEDRPPMPPLNLVADFGGGGMFLAFGVVAALVSRTLRGYGQVVDAAMVDGVAALHAMAHSMRNQGVSSDERHSNLLDGAAHFYTTYECADGQFFAVGALEPQFYRVFVEGLDLEPGDWPQFDRARWAAQRADIAEIIGRHDRSYWMERYEGTDACVAPVNRLDEVAADPHLSARSTFVQDRGGVQPAPAPRFGTDRPELVGSPPLPGEHTVAALESWGFDGGRIAALIEQRIVFRRV